MILKLRSLSIPQLRIVQQMHKESWYLVTNEGTGFKCWMETQDLKKVNDWWVNKRTAESLCKSGWIECIQEELSPYRHFHYRLTQKAIKALERKI